MQILVELAMLVIYFCIFMPLGFFLRVTGYDILRLKLDRQANTYWQDRAKPANPASYYKQS